VSPTLGPDRDHRDRLAELADTGVPVRGPLFDFAPAIDEYLKTHLFGDIFERDSVDWQSRAGYRWSGNWPPHPKADVSAPVDL
jgi:hypothetical protein